MFKTFIFITLQAYSLHFLPNNKLFRKYAVVIKVFTNTFLNTSFAENLLMASSEHLVILILLLNYGKSEPCHSYKLCSYKKSMYEMCGTCSKLNEEVPS